MKRVQLSVRTMERREVDLAVEWAAREGWNPGLADAECFHAADPEGFLIGEAAGEPVACISAVAYGVHYGFIGFYIVKPEHRGRGYGLHIWNQALQRLQGRTIGLDGVPAQQQNYAASGFSLAYSSVRRQGLSAPGGGGSRTLTDLASLPFATVEDYDRQLFPAPRTGFLRCWLAQPGAAALGFMDGGRLQGYGVLRPCRLGWKVGPLFADSAAGAEALLQGLTKGIPAGEPFFLDSPEANARAVELAEDLGMTPVFETARMYRGEAPQMPLERLFGVTTFELG